jgi:hypothetical protein
MLGRKKAALPGKNIFAAGRHSMGSSASIMAQALWLWMDSRLMASTR